MFKKIIIFSGLLFIVIFVLLKYTKVNPREMLAGVFFVNSITEEQLKAKPVVRILVVPGHDNEYSGTEYRGILESDLNVELGEYLTNYLRREPKFQVYLIRNQTGYDKDYLNYLNVHEEEIIEFQKHHKIIMETLSEFDMIESNDVSYKSNKSLSDIAKRLYGINKWSNDNGMDIVLHVHFNDYPGREFWSGGKYSGSTIYIPDRQYSNSKISRSVAEPISKFLSKFFAQSDLPIEKDKQGIKETQSFIAPGAFNTLDAAGLLIEYGYIYEPQFTNPNTRESVLREMAWQTYLGVLDFFGGGSEKGSLILPYRWNFDLKKGTNDNRDVLALQFFLTNEGFYPPQSSDFNDCPVSGSFGNCTLQAVKDFQEKYSIMPSSGFVGELTRKRLNVFK